MFDVDDLSGIACVEAHTPQPTEQIIFILVRVLKEQSGRAFAEIGFSMWNINKTVASEFRGQIETLVASVDRLCIYRRMELSSAVETGFLVPNATIGDMTVPLGVQTQYRLTLDSADGLSR